MNALLVQLKNYFRTDHRGAVAVYLFGSTARGTDSPGSDIDIGVLYREPPPRSLDAPSLTLKGDIEAMLHRTVDIVVLNHASPDLCHRVFRDGILVLDRDRAFRIRFEVKMRNEYLDLLPVLRRYRRYPEERVGR
jgi:predicted nucleotidyltransferase